MEKIKKIIADNWINACLLVFAVFAVTVCYTLYNRSRVGTDYSDVKTTVRAVEADNQRATNRVKSAGTKINTATAELSRSIKRADKSTARIKRAEKRTGENQRIIKECKDGLERSRKLTSEAEDIFKAVDERNKGTGAQADGT